MTDDRFALRVELARRALEVADSHGFALGGGQALVAHGLVQRPTEDVDLFTDREGGVRDALPVVRDALSACGFDVAHAVGETDLSDTFYGMDDAFEELSVTVGEAEVQMSLACMPRQRPPVLMELGPVVHLDDLLGSKFCALTGRNETRDYIDVAAALANGFTRDQLLALAHEHEPDLSGADIAAAMRRLDDLDDDEFADYGLDRAATDRLRSAFAAWSRD
ncbi:nucleotidyl transferase AbiEii/AbiGii toxin family protein [Catenuloplanes sp. NPDC051500]|uniref:nucleotidyl transferase AbiEii/AbiGii toxin family protein n=1 Tax=Catenuloplanes sp. NPDC051500 TaxID=3363959 RepID=UPI0037B9EEA0